MVELATPTNVVELDTRPTSPARFYLMSQPDRERLTRQTLFRIDETMRKTEPWDQKEVNDVIENLILLRMYDPSQSNVTEPLALMALATNVAVAPVAAKHQFEQHYLEYITTAAKRSGLSDEIATTLAYFRQHGILFTGKRTAQVYFTDKGKDDWIHPEILKTRYSHLNMDVPDSKRKINIVDYALNENIFRKATLVTFDPSNHQRYYFSKEHGAYIYNTWRGWPFADVDVMPHYVAKSKIPLFLDHVAAMCDYDPKVYDHFLGIMAHMVQFPWKRMGVSLALVGEMGAGKDVLFKLFSKIFHPDHATVMSQSNFVSRFTSALESKLFVHMAEMQFKRYDSYDKLKDLITNEKSRLEAKGIDDKEEPIFANFVITTNHGDAFPITDRERRLFIIQVSNAWSIDPLKPNHDEVERITDRFTKLFKETEANIPALYHFFNTYPLKDFRPQAYPRTDARQSMVIASKVGIERWGMELLETGIIKTHAENLYTEWHLNEPLRIYTDELKISLADICREDRLPLKASPIAEMMSALYLPPKDKAGGDGRMAGFSGLYYKRESNGRTYFLLPPRQWCIDRSPLKDRV